MLFIIILNDIADVLKKSLSEKNRLNYVPVQNVFRVAQTET